MSSGVFYRSLDKEYPEAVSGRGVYLFASSGKKILDGSSGAAVSSIGHGHPEVVGAIIEQLRKLSFAHSSFFTSRPTEKLAKYLLDHSHGAFSRVNFLCSGSEAVESALKLTRQYHLYNGEPERVNFIGRAHSYHGNTLGALAIGNNPARRKALEPILSPSFHHVNRCFYDADGAGRTEQVYEDALIAEFEAKILDIGSNTVAGIVVEPVGGATLGAVPATRTYLPRLRELCDKHGIILIFDEVMCGMARVGTYHAWESLGGVAPDIQTIGKGLGGGYQPLSAVLLSPKVVNLFEQKSKGADKFVSGHTFQDHSVACAGALAVQTILEREDALSNVNAMGSLLVELLTSSLPHGLVEASVSFRGLGLFRTIDFGDAKSQYGGPLAADIAEEAFKLGAAVYLCSPAVDAILFAPPLIISASEIAELADIFLRAVQNVISKRLAEVTN
ncbi:unnamed protein product [Clonostachys rosea]|uniref:Uncharacterized protein n=1 Tax=Bionectria ochroleuca TaxID=29856 RepID=A0ABY6TP62_BIOOC|nr:unnamed protein product [Clonostachys rosea]